MIERLELTLFDSLRPLLSAADSMRVVIGYFRHCDEQELVELLPMPKAYWDEEAAEMIVRLKEQEKR